MRLYHVTAAVNRASIAANGFRDSVRDHATGVFLSPPGFLWQDDGMVWIGGVAPQPGPELAVYAFDLPDDVAAEFAAYYEDGPVHPAVPFVRDADGLALYEFCVPAAVANKFLVGEFGRPAWRNRGGRSDRRAAAKGTSPSASRHSGL